ARARGLGWMAAVPFTSLGPAEAVEEQAARPVRIARSGAGAAQKLHLAPALQHEADAGRVAGGAVPVRADLAAVHRRRRLLRHLPAGSRRQLGRCAVELDHDLVEMRGVVLLEER